MINFISDISQYDIVLNLAINAKRSLWIGTADIKDLHVIQGRLEKPFLEILSYLTGKGVEVRLIHTKEPDQKICYVGSANLTGAGMGMKSLYRRNFEAGIKRLGMTKDRFEEIKNR